MRGGIDLGPLQRREEVGIFLRDRETMTDPASQLRIPALSEA
jgi:hypothetical protein